MDYTQPLGADDPNAAFVDANPAAGVEGSPIPAAALEHPQREIVGAITAAGLSPDANNLEQLAAAIEILARRSACMFGEIRMYSGDAAGISAGWFVCDGSNGTPDLRDKFVIGSKGLSDIGQTGGSTHSVTSADGRHNHSVSVTVGAHTLSSAQMPSHSHRVQASVYGSGTGYTQTGANHSSSLHARTHNTGSSHAHSHGASASSEITGAHTHSVETMPPYYTVAFIQYRGG